MADRRDWFIVFLGAVIMGLAVLDLAEPSAREHETRLACIQAGMEWIDGDCRKEAK